VIPDPSGYWNLEKSVLSSCCKEQLVRIPALNKTIEQQLGPAQSTTAYGQPTSNTSPANSGSETEKPKEANRNTPERENVVLVTARSSGKTMLGLTGWIDISRPERCYHCGSDLEAEPMA